MEGHSGVKVNYREVITVLLNISWKGSYSGCLVINSAFLASRSFPLCFSYKRKHHFSNKWFRRSMLSVENFKGSMDRSI